MRVDRDLIDVAPPRTLVAASAGSAGPPSFTADGRYVYFTSLDEGITFERSRLVRVEVATGELTVVNRDIYGGGGSISPDGKTYAFARADGDRHNLALLDLPSGNVRVLAAQPPGAFVSLPRYAPDGQRLVAMVFDGTSFSIRIFDARTGAVLAHVTDGRDAVHDASWADATHVVYLRSDSSDGGFPGLPGRYRQWTVAPAHPRSLPRFRATGGGRAAAVSQPRRLALDARRARGELGGNPAAAAGAGTDRDRRWRWQSPPAPTRPVWPVWPLPVDDSPIQVVNDSTYRQTDHLFDLQTHAVDFVAIGRQGSLAALTLGGADRLQFHRWALNGLWQLGADRPGYGGTVAYANQLFAPFSIIVDALALRYHDTLPPPSSPLTQPAVTPGPFVLEKTLLQAHLSINRQFYGAPATAGFQIIDDDQPAEPTLSVHHRRLAGPYLKAEYDGLESTPYSGIRRQLFGSALCWASSRRPGTRPGPCST